MEVAKVEGYLERYRMLRSRNFCTPVVVRSYSYPIQQGFDAATTSRVPQPIESNKLYY